MKLQFLVIFCFSFFSKLSSQNAYLSIQANITDATITLNKVEKGKTPYEAMITPGTYNLIITKSLSEDEEYYYSEKIILKANDIKKLNITISKRYTDKYLKKKEEDERKIKEAKAKLEEIQKNVKQGSFVDTRDNKTYKTMNIGTQTWFAENLAFQTDTKGLVSGASNNDKYYNWETSQEVCPNGWKLPSKSDWELLLLYFGIDEEEIVPSGWNDIDDADDRPVIDKIKSKTGWYPTQDGTKDGNGANSFGFNVYPKGKYTKNATLEDFGKIAFFWMSDVYVLNNPEGSNTKYISWIEIWAWSIDRQSGTKSGYSNEYMPVRCIKQ
jgi:uncharacterized protein (TIGR02145 family)